jgi:Fe-S cluster assembly ATP-binding protein
MNSTDTLLDVRDLHVEVAGHDVLKGVTLALPAGQLHVLMGANGSGKSTLGLALAGHPNYHVTSGSVQLAGKDLLALAPELRAQAGLFLSFQAPPDIPGVKNSLLVRTALKSVRQSQGEKPLDGFDFLKTARAVAKDLGLPAQMLNRPVNDGFSGGERKRNELLQLSLLKPRLAILDEIDSGLDVDGVRAVTTLVEKLRAEGMSFLVVSHYLQMIESLHPDAVHRMDGGCIAETGDIGLARRIAKTGYVHMAAAATVEA